MTRLLVLVVAISVVVPGAHAAAQDRAADLPAPAEVSQRSVRELANLEIVELQLTRERSQSDVDQALAITLYVGAVLGAIGAVSLTVGAIMEGVCIDGDVSACLDGPSFVAAAIPTAIITTVLFFGATLYQKRVDTRARGLDERGREIEERRRRLEGDLGLAVGPTSLMLRGSF